MRPVKRISAGSKGRSQAHHAENMSSQLTPSAPEGSKPWRSSTKLVSGRKLTATRFKQVVEVEHEEDFTLQPLIITSGPMKGRRILLVEPVITTVPDHSRFLDLPAELRKMIYDILLEEESPVCLNTLKAPAALRRPVGTHFPRLRYDHPGLKYDKTIGKYIGKPPSAYSILRVNKQLHKEAAPIAYGCNTFEFDNLSSLVFFLDAIGSMRQHLRYIKIGRNGYMRSKVTTVCSRLKDAKGLRALTFDHYVVCASGDRSITRGRFAADVGPLLRSLNRTRTIQDSSVHILDIVKVERIDAISCVCHEADEVCFKPWPCRVECKDLSAHNDEAERELKALFSKEVGIKQ